MCRANLQAAGARVMNASEEQFSYKWPGEFFERRTDVIWTPQTVAGLFLIQILIFEKKLRFSWGVYMLLSSIDQNEDKCILIMAF